MSNGNERKYNDKLERPKPYLAPIISVVNFDSVCQLTLNGISTYKTSQGEIKEFPYTKSCITHIRDGGVCVVLP